MLMQKDEARPEEPRGGIMSRYMEDSQEQLAAVHGAGLSDAEVQRTKQGLQDDVVRVRVGRSVQSVYADSSEEIAGDAQQPAQEEGSASSGAADGGSPEGECSAGPGEGLHEAGAAAQDEMLQEGDYYDTYMNATSDEGLEYYDDYFAPGPADA
jgi:hypothetical protein